MKNITPKSLTGLTAETSLLVMDGGNKNVALSPQATALKLQLLNIASDVTAVAKPEDVAPAVHTVRELKRMLNSVEAARKLVKDPVLKLGQRIDETAKNYVAEFMAEILRIEGGKGADGKPVKGLLGAWNDQETLRIQVEEKRIAEETEAAQRELAKSIEAQDNLSVNASVKTEMKVEAKVQQAIANVTAAASQVAAPAVSAAGMRAKMTVFHEIQDAAALYAVRPEWFDLVPKASVMKAAINKTTKLPGLKVWEAIDTKVRA